MRHVKNVYDAKRTYACVKSLCRKNDEGLPFDVLLAAYLLDTNDNNADIEGA